MLRPGSSPRPNAPSVARPASTTSTASTTSSPAAVGSGRSRKLRRCERGRVEQLPAAHDQEPHGQQPDDEPEDDDHARLGDHVCDTSRRPARAGAGTTRSPRTVITISTGVITPSMTPAIAMPESLSAVPSTITIAEADQPRRQLRQALVQIRACGPARGR